MIRHLHQRYSTCGWRMTMENRNDHWVHWWSDVIQRYALAPSHYQIFNETRPSKRPLSNTDLTQHQVHICILQSSFDFIPQSDPPSFTTIYMIRNEDLDGMISGYDFPLTNGPLLILGTGSMLTSTCVNPTMYRLRGLHPRTWYWTISRRSQLEAIDDERSDPRDHYTSTHRTALTRSGHRMTIMRIRRPERHVSRLHRALESSPTRRFRVHLVHLLTVLPIQDLCLIVLSHIWCCWICYANSIPKTLSVEARPCMLDRRRALWVWYHSNRRLTELDRFAEDEENELDNDELIY